MKKEELTIDDIKYDLRCKMLEEFKRLAVFSVLFIFFLGLILIVIFSDIFVSALAWGSVLLGEIILLLLIVKQIQKSKLRYKDFNSEICVVKDKLVNTEFVKMHLRKAGEEPFHLYFSKYGKYVIPSENHRWSSAFFMYAAQVNNSANIGDEYYLVVVKPNKGRILLAYNTKMFDFEEKENGCQENC